MAAERGNLALAVRASVEAQMLKDIIAGVEQEQEEFVTGEWVEIGGKIYMFHAI